MREFGRRAGGSEADQLTTCAVDRGVPIRMIGRDRYTSDFSRANGILRSCLQDWEGGLLVKGQRSVSWDEPGEGTPDPTKNPKLIYA